MPINTICTGCGKLLSVADQHVGHRARCPACGQIYTVPLKSTTGDSGGEIVSPISETGAPSNTAIDWSPTNSMPPQSGQAQAPADQFWMRATDGNVYGPVDRSNLDRWFMEGRVGMAYQIRQGETGAWQEASRFRPSVQANPYAAQADYGTRSPYTPTSSPAGGLHRYAKPDRGALVLVMGILSFLVCGAFGIAAVVIGRSALRDIDSGQANPNDKTMVQIGFWLGVANLVLHLLAFGGFLLMIAVSVVAA